MKNPSKGLNLLPDFGEAYISKNPDKAIEILTETIKYLQTGRTLYLHKKSGNIWMTLINKKF